jgi:hypothetical protein
LNSSFCSFFGCLVKHFRHFTWCDGSWLRSASFFVSLSFVPWPHSTFGHLGAFRSASFVFPLLLPLLGMGLVAVTWSHAAATSCCLLACLLACSLARRSLFGLAFLPARVLSSDDASLPYGSIVPLRALIISFSRFFSLPLLSPHAYFVLVSRQLLPLGAFPKPQWLAIWALREARFSSVLFVFVWCRFCFLCFALFVSCVLFVLFVCSKSTHRSI